jgi:hypothetical protein
MNNLHEEQSLRFVRRAPCAPDARGANKRHAERERAPHRLAVGLMRNRWSGRAADMTRSPCRGDRFPAAPRAHAPALFLGARGGPGGRVAGKTGQRGNPCAASSRSRAQALAEMDLAPVEARGRARSISRDRGGESTRGCPRSVARLRSRQVRLRSGGLPTGRTAEPLRRGCDGSVQVDGQGFERWAIQDSNL